MVKTCILSLLILLFTVLFQQGLDAQQPVSGLPQYSETKSGHKVAYFLEAPQVTKFREKQSMALPGFTNTGSLKGYAVPVKHDLVWIGDKSSADLSYTLGEPKDYRGIHLPVAWKPEADGPRGLGGNGEVQSPVELLDILTYRGQSVALVRICPFAYDPDNAALAFYPQISYRLNTGSPGRKEEFTNRHGQALNRHVLNPPKRKNSAHVAEWQQERILMVTSDSLKPYLQNLINWKTKLGFEICLLSDKEWSYESLRQQIADTCAVMAEIPDYLWIIGDVEHVPAKADSLVDPEDNSARYYYTDLYYACLDGGNDYLPDMNKARLPASNPEELEALIARMISFQKTPPEEETYYQSASVLGEFQDDDNDTYSDRRFIKTCEEIKDHLQGLNYLVDRVYFTGGDITPYYYNNGYYAMGEQLPFELWKSNGYKWNGGSSAALKVFRRGRFLIFYRGHGSPGGWAHPSLGNSQLYWVNNEDVLPVVFSLTCSSGAFDRNDSFAENLLLSQSGGAAACFAASAVSYSGYNDALSIGMIDAVWPELLAGFGSGGIQEPEVSEHESIRVLGKILLQGLLRMTQTWGGSGSIIYTYELYHLFGDPTMEIYTHKPQEIPVLPQDISMPANDLVEVQAPELEGLHVTLSAGDSLLARTQVENGKAVLTPDPENGLFSGAVVTFSGSGYIPKIIDLQAHITDISQQTELQAIQVFPNPSAGVFILQTEGYGLEKVAVFDITGRMIREYQNPASDLQIDLRQKPKGLYLLRLVTDGGKVKALRLLKK